MQQWLDLIAIVGAVLNLAADVINLADALFIRRDAAQVRKATPSHARSTESVTLAGPDEVRPTAQHDGRPARR
jgi:hypothetical protein